VVGGGVSVPAQPVDPATDTLAEVERRLGYHFADPALLLLALTHRSWCAEHEGYEPNERLEFLGDSVLGLVVTDHIYRCHPELAEGQLAKVRAAVVSAAALADVAAELDLGVGLRLGRGEEASGGRGKASILADALEAVLGAIYLDGGWEPARELVLRRFGTRVAHAASGPGTQDYKTRLQELVARRGGRPPEYLVVEEGPDHEKVFHATVAVAGLAQGRGQGRSKKQAQQAAARQAWLALIEADVEPAAESDIGTAAAPGAGEPRRGDDEPPAQ
jgi:ribonuclease-3